MTLNVITVQNTTKFLTNVILWKLDFIQCGKKIDILRNMKEEARLLMILRLTFYLEVRGWRGEAQHVRDTAKYDVHYSQQSVWMYENCLQVVISLLSPIQTERKWKLKRKLSLMFVIYYRPQRSCDKVMFLHLSVILFTRGSATHPPGRHPLPSACWDTVNKRAVRILLECILVLWCFLSVLWSCSLSLPFSLGVNKLLADLLEGIFCVLVPTRPSSSPSTVM